jgi:hypothetical protein|tara:strand:- start:508 stop:1155 length:648 start_codon:yes stop_codon:yes gene_type:complete
MAKYFNYFPKTFYSSNNASTGLDSVTNIIARFGFEQSLKNNSSAFYKYQIQESDTPEIIAYKYYGSAEKHWIVLLFNDIIDPQFDWPLTYDTLIDFVDAKYTANGAANTTVQSGLAWAMSTNNVQAYYKIVTKTDIDNVTLIEKIQVDANTYANVATSSTTITLQSGDVVTQAVTKEKKTYYDYEMEQNESKREITLIKNEFVKDIEKEFKRVIK